MINRLRKLIGDADEALISALKVGEDREAQKKTPRPAKGERRARLEKRRLPLITLPTFDAAQRGALSRTLLPSPEGQVDEMAAFLRDREPYHWNRSGADRGMPGMDRFLAPHPGLMLKRAILQITQSRFWPELHIAFESYFCEAGAPGHIDAVRVFDVYACYLYLSGSARNAARIADLVAITDDLAALRAQLDEARDFHNRQRAEVEALFGALDLYALNPRVQEKPDWRSYLKTRI